MDSGELPSHGSGPTRRIVFEDLMTYKQKTYEARSKVLDEMVALSQELGLYDLPPHSPTNLPPIR